MRAVNVFGLLRSERGIALPTAMIALMLLTTLLIAFAVLSKSEPTIAANQAQTSQARALAEAGVERALWAVTNTVIPNPMVGTIGPAPYDGSTFLALGTVGGFFVTVKNGTASNERVVDAVGWTPTNATTDPRTKAHKALHATLTRLKFSDSPPPAALAIRGDLAASGNASVSSEADTSCGAKPAAYSTGTQTATAGANLGGAPGQLPNVPTSVFDQYILTDADLAALRAAAQASGTYLQGNQTFSSMNPIPANGLVFIDTVGGVPISCTGSPSTCTPPASQIPTVTIGASAQPVGSTAFSGWLIVNGSITLNGPGTLNGMVYAQDAITMAGSMVINGALISRNIIHTSATINVVTGTTTITYNCAYAKTGAGTIPPPAWTLKAGAYREVSD